MNQILGWNTSYCVFGLLVFAGIYSIYGGLKSVAWTDVLQVVFLVGGGLITAYFALDAVGGDAGNAWDGFKQILGIVRDNASDRHFNMIIPEGSIVANDKGELVDIFQDIPGLAVILGAMWLTNLGYWASISTLFKRGLQPKASKRPRRVLFSQATSRFSSRLSW
jgi:SSS family solute:Na+ symporter